MVKNAFILLEKRENVVSLFTIPFFFPHSFYLFQSKRLVIWFPWIPMVCQTPMWSWNWSRILEVRANRRPKLLSAASTPPGTRPSNCKTFFCKILSSLLSLLSLSLTKCRLPRPNPLFLRVCLTIQLKENIIWLLLFVRSALQCSLSFSCRKEDWNI